VSDPLEAALQRIEGIRVVLPAPGAVEYSFVGDMLEDPRARLAELFDRLWRVVSKYADVQTPAACTTVAWSGNLRSAVSTLAGPLGLQEHSRAVANDLATRTQWLRILIASTAVVTSVAAATANPVAIPSAFRAGWKLVSELEAVLGAPIA
jgi:hypothetical protein